MSRRYYSLLLLLFFLFAKQTKGQNEMPAIPADASPEQAKAIRASDKIRAILEHYKQPDPVGMPGVPIPDPMPIPDMKQHYAVGTTMNFKQTTVEGLSQFRIISVNSHLDNMQVEVQIRVELLTILGNYSLRSFFTTRSGPYNVTLEGVDISGVANLAVDRDGQLEAEDIKMNIVTNKILVKFENLGVVGGLFQGVINSVGPFLFDNIKPYILSQVNKDIRQDVNKEIRKLPQRFPNSISPLDMAIAEGRKYVRNMNYDPYLIASYNYTAGVVFIELNHIWINGLSTFYRVGNISLSMLDNILSMRVHVGTQRLEGRCLWEVGLGGHTLARTGTGLFTVEYLHVEVNVSQPLDTRKRPKLEELELTLGNIQLRVDGAGTIDYLLEFAVNVIPNMLRYQIMNAVEGPVKKRIQYILNQTDVQELIEQQMPMLDEMETGNTIYQ